MCMFAEDQIDILIGDGLVLRTRLMRLGHPTPG